MSKFDFSNGLHTNGMLDPDKCFLYDKLKEQEKKEKDEEQRSPHKPRNLTK